MSNGLAQIINTFVAECPRGAYARLWVSEKYQLNAYRRIKRAPNRHRWSLYKLGSGKRVTEAQSLKRLIANAVSLKLEGEL